VSEQNPKPMGAPFREMLEVPIERPRREPPPPLAPGSVVRIVGDLSGDNPLTVVKLAAVEGGNLTLAYWCGDLLMQVELPESVLRRCRARPPMGPL
jgi:hypothetical protein